MKKKNEDNPENLGGLGDLVPAEVLKKLNELLELLHQSGDTNHGTTVINYYAEGSWHVDNSTIGTVNNNNGDCSHAFEGHFPTAGKTATKEMMSRAARITLDGGCWKSQRSWSVAFVVYCIWGYKGRVSDFLTEVDGWPDGVADRMACNRDAVEKLKNTYYFSNNILDWRKDGVPEQYMRESDKPARQAEKAYKKEKNARNTSSKAQKGEALQEPGGIIRYNVVKVSNNRFYKHAENNKETGYDGQQWFLHQYMFSTELLSLINAKGGIPGEARHHVAGLPQRAQWCGLCQRRLSERLYAHDVLGCVYLYQNLTAAVHQCEDALFGQLLQDMYDNEARDTLLRRVYDKTAKFYSLLPEEFTTQDVMKTWGYSRIDSASKKIADLIKNNQIEKVKKGSYKKLATAI